MNVTVKCPQCSEQNCNCETKINFSLKDGGQPMELMCGHVFMVTWCDDCDEIKAIVSSDKKGNAYCLECLEVLTYHYPKRFDMNYVKDCLEGLRR